MSRKLLNYFQNDLPPGGPLPADFILRHPTRSLTFAGITRRPTFDSSGFLRFALWNVFFVVPILVNFIHTDSGADKIGFLFLVTYYFVISIKFTSLVYYKADLWALLDTLHSAWDKTKIDFQRTILTETERNSNIYFVLYAIMIWTVVLFWNLTPLAIFLVKKFYLKIDDIHIQVMFKRELGFDESKYYGAVHYLHYVITASVSMTYNILTESLFVILSLHVAAIFRLAQRRLASLRLAAVPLEEVLAELDEIVQLEDVGIKCAAYLEKIYGYPLLIHFSIQSFKICFAFWQISNIISDPSSLSVGNIIILIEVLVVEIFITFLLSFAGQMIINEKDGIRLTKERYYTTLMLAACFQSSAVFEVLYDTAWYKTNDPRLKKYILIIMHRAEKPITIKVGKLYDVSLEIFTAIMQAAMSYFTFLQSVRT